MLLKELLENVKIKQIIGSENIDISAITIDSKKVQKNNLFICLKGENFDGHECVCEAEKFGAVAVIVERRLDTDLTQIIVDDARAAMSKIAANFYDNPSKNMKIVGVTGTNGKTTVTHIIKHILESSGKKVGLIGTLGVFFGKTFYEPTLTTPDPIELHKILKEMYDYGIDYVVMEVSAHAIDLKKIDDIRFEVGVFTNLTQDHLDYFKDMQTYKSVKTSFFENSRCKYSVINSDDEVGRQLISNIYGDCLSYGIDNPSDVFAINIKEKISGISFVMNLFDSVYKINSKLIGKFNVSNMLAAAVTAGVLGINQKIIANAISEFKGVDGRLEKVVSDSGINVFIDYAHTPDGLKNSLNALKNVTDGNLFCVFGCGGNRDDTKRPLMGEISGNIADFSVITSDNPRYEEPMDIIRQIESGILKITKEYVIVQKREKAIEYALKKLKNGDTMLVAGKGAEKFQEILGIKHNYNDKDFIINCYRELKN